MYGQLLHTIYYGFQLVLSVFVNSNQFKSVRTEVQFEPVATSCDRFFAVFFRFQSGFFCISKLGNRLRLRLRPNMKKNRTQPNF
jgi:hypothetical protein